MGATALATVSGQQPPTQPARPAGTPPPKPPVVRVNRTVPRVTPPPAFPQFSAQPSEAEITRARVFSEPLVPLGATVPTENAALAEAITAYLKTGQSEMVAPFRAFLVRFPGSAWRASLLANLGVVYRRTGYHTRALDAWDEAWQVAKARTDLLGRAVADMAVGYWLELTTKTGNLPALTARVQEVEGRDVRGAAAARVTMAREGYWSLTNQHHEASSSGAVALEILLRLARGPEASIPTALGKAHPVPEGMSLRDLGRLAEQIGVPVRLVAREGAAPIPVPAILHFKTNHFAAVVKAESGRFLLQDPLLGGEQWVGQAALDDQLTGFAAVPALDRTAGWRELSGDEGTTVIGHCAPGVGDPDEGEDGCRDPNGCPPPPPPGGPCGESGDAGTGGNDDPSGDACPKGMPIHTFNVVQASLRLHDIPLSYSPPRGPALSFQLTYNHRDVQLPQIPSFGNLGSQWTWNWLALPCHLRRA